MVLQDRRDHVVRSARRRLPIVVVRLRHARLLSGTARPIRRTRRGGAPGHHSGNRVCSRPDRGYGRRGDGAFAEWPGPCTRQWVSRPPPRVGFFTDTSSASGARRARSRARSGTGVPEDGLALHRRRPTTTRGELDARHVAPRRVHRTARTAAVDETTAGEPVDPDGRRAGRCRRTCASTARTPPASTCARPARSSGPSSAPSTSSRTSATGAGTASPACPYGVIDQAEGDGGAWKCTLCYERLRRRWNRRAPRRARPSRSSSADSTSCAPAPTQRVAELHDRGRHRRPALRRRSDDGVGGDGAFFLLLDEPEVYGLPPDPVATTRDLPSMWRRVGVAAAALAGCGLVVVRRPPMNGRRGRRREQEDGPASGVHLVLRPTGAPRADLEGSRTSPGTSSSAGSQGGSSLVAAGAQLTGRRGLAASPSWGSTAAAGLSLVALVARPRAAGALPQHVAR